MGSLELPYCSRSDNYLPAARSFPGTEPMAAAGFALLISALLIIARPLAHGDIAGLHPLRRKPPRFQEARSAPLPPRAKARFTKLRPGSLWHRWAAPI